MDSYERALITIKGLVFNSLTHRDPFDLLFRNRGRIAPNYRKTGRVARLRRHFDAYGNEGAFVSSTESSIAGQGRYATARIDLQMDGADHDRPVSLMISSEDDARYLIAVAEAFIAEQRR